MQSSSLTRFVALYAVRVTNILGTLEPWFASGFQWQTQTKAHFKERTGTWTYYD